MSVILNSQEAAQRLEEWLRASAGVYIHSSLRFAYNEHNGVHWQAFDGIDAKEVLLSIPHSHCLSYLNAMADDAYPVFRQKRNQFSVEAIGFFYLMLQYIHRKTSFWRPYLETLPSPEPNLSIPLWYDPEDDDWLADTDVSDNMTKRKIIHEEYYRGGCEILAAAGVDISQFSWELFRWSITMFTSRSFSSRAITPQDSKYWATYKTNANGTRQTVLLDMSRTPSADLDFSVLFPGMDAGNHNDQCEALWTFDPGRFRLALRLPIETNTQIFNNYGPKSNHELLQGYGFAVENNPNDSVLLTLKTPSSALQTVLRPLYAGYFDTNGQWLSEKATFGLKLAKTDTSDSQAIFDQLPLTLLELLLLIMKDEQGGEFDSSVLGITRYQDVKQRYLPHLARNLSQSIAQRYSKLTRSTPSKVPSNRKQMYAKHYRDGQIRILQNYLQGFQEYIHSIAWQYSRSDSCVRLARLEHVVSSLQQQEPKTADQFLQGIKANAQSSDIDELRAAGWEEDIWVLLLSYLRLLHSENPFCLWVARLLEDYSEPHSDDTAPVEQLDSLLEVVHVAAHAVPGSIWEAAAWSRKFIASSGARVFARESFVITPTDGDSLPEPRLAVLWFDAEG